MDVFDFENERKEFESEAYYKAVGGGLDTAEQEGGWSGLCWLKPWETLELEVC